MSEHSPSRRQGSRSLAAYSIDAFCETHSISRSMYYQLVKQGIGPRVTNLGSQKRVIFIEDAARWRAERAAASE
jgi:hypothetical protein